MSKQVAKKTTKTVAKPQFQNSHHILKNMKANLKKTIESEPEQ